MKKVSLNNHFNCGHCHKNSPYDGDKQPVYIDGPNLLGTIEVCQKCDQKISAVRDCQCNICNAFVANDEILIVKEKGQKGQRQFCRECVRYTLLWAALDGIIDTWFHFRFEEPDPIKKVVGKKVVNKK